MSQSIANYQFRTRLNVFEATLNDSKTFLKIGGKKYKDCINIAIVIKDGIPVYAKIPHLESEPECGVEKFLDKSEKDASVDFISGALQFVNSIFPSITRFEFMDDSKIECDVKEKAKERPPRKITKPLSLAHLYIAKYGSSWYELKFNAKLINERMYNDYKKATDVLSRAKNMTYDEFKAENSLSEEQEQILKPLYEASESWQSFFNSVPRESMCKAFSMWLPFFINKLLNYTFSQNTWYIDITTMPKTEFSRLNVLLGGRRKTAKRRGSLSFSNNLSYGALL